MTTNTAVQQTSSSAPATAQTPSDAQQARDLARTIEKAVNDAINTRGDGGRTGFDREQFRNQLRTQIRDAIRGTQEAVATADGDGQFPTPPTPPPPPGLPEYSTSGVPPELIHAIRETAPRIVSMLSITLVLCVVGFPLARAIARWIDRRGAKAPVMSRDMDSRLQGIEQAVESIAVEVERISEGQRFTTKLLNERSQPATPDFRGAQRDGVAVGSAPMSTSKI